MAIYDFVGLILGHFGPMFGPTTHSVSWRYVGLILAQVAILGHFKAMLGLSGVMCVKKNNVSCMGAQFLNFWCYVACSLWDV